MFILEMNCIYLAFLWATSCQVDADQNRADVEIIAVRCELRDELQVEPRAAFATH